MKEKLFHIAARKNVPIWQSWLIRISAIIFGLLLCALLGNILIGSSFGAFFKNIFDGCFGSSRRIWKLLKSIAILLGIALALVPAFRMHFWNIGAEGQVLFGALCATVILYKFGGNPDTTVVVLLGSFVLAILGGALWGFIPAFFKAVFHTNETLFTLMMNYVASYLVAFALVKWTPSGNSTIGMLKTELPVLFGNEYIIPVVLVALMAIGMFIYLNYSKHGYEISVVGESIRTAEYVGINVKKVIIRTMILSGALCGLMGFLLMAGLNHTLTTTSAGGNGFTAIMVAWLANFNPLIMIVSAFMIVFMQQGTAQFADTFNISNAFPNVVLGIILFFVIGCEFFIRYKIVINKNALHKGGATHE